MKIIILFLALLTIATARPTIEFVKDEDMPALIVDWHKYHYTRPQPMRAKGIDKAEQMQKDDVILWETYTGQPIAVGDWFYADFPKQGIFNAFRECKKITATEITTLAGTTIPLTQVKGIVRRVVRVIP